MPPSTSLQVDGTRGYAQGEIFLLTDGDEHTDALVYNTTGFGPCPKEPFEAIDVDALARAKGVDHAWKNPRRWWMMDALTLALAGEPEEFGGVEFNLAAKMQMPAGMDLEQDQSAQAYNRMQIRRVSTYRFSAGQPVFLLRSPDAVTWVMQTYTDHVDPTLTEGNLPELGERLELPEGWDFRSVTVPEDLTITTEGVANITPDNLSNMYQGCVDGVSNFDPWS